MQPFIMSIGNFFLGKKKYVLVMVIYFGNGKLFSERNFLVRVRPEKNHQRDQFMLHANSVRGSLRFLAGSRMLEVGVLCLKEATFVDVSTRCS